MDKLTLTGLGSDKNRLFFIIKKGKGLRPFLAYLLLKCGFENNIFLTEYDDDHIDVINFEDTQSNYKNDDFDIDIIFGHRCIVLVIRIKNEKKRQFISNIIGEFTVPIKK